MYYPGVYSNAYISNGCGLGFGGVGLYAGAYGVRGYGLPISNGGRFVWSAWGLPGYARGNTGSIW